MVNPPPHLRTLKEIECYCIFGLVEVLQTESIEGVRYTLWDMTGWHRDYDPCVWRSGPPRSRSDRAGRCGCVWRRHLQDPEQSPRVPVEEIVWTLEDGPE